MCMYFFDVVLIPYLLNNFSSFRKWRRSYGAEHLVLITHF